MDPGPAPEDPLGICLERDLPCAGAWAGGTAVPEQPGLLLQSSGGSLRDPSPTPAGSACDLPGEGSARRCRTARGQRSLGADPVRSPLCSAPGGSQLDPDPLGSPRNLPRRDPLGADSRLEAALRRAPSRLLPLPGSGEIPAGSEPGAIHPGMAPRGIHLVTELGRRMPLTWVSPAGRGAPRFSGDPRGAPAPGRSPGIRLERDPLGAGAQSVGAALSEWAGRAKPAPCSAELCGDPRWIPGDLLREGSAWCWHVARGCCHLGAALQEGVGSSLLALRRSQADPHCGPGDPPGEGSPAADA